MKAYQREFLEFAERIGAIRFGEFVLKSGRVSPYFFNAGSFDSGHKLARLGHFYARAATDAGIGFDVLFGPAYKGIPLAIATAMALAADGRDVPFAFNRKEEKGHGEGGITIGAPLRGRVLIVDDVITSGLSVAEAVKTIATAGATPAGVLIALDRQERGAREYSAVQEVEHAHNMPVISIVNVETLLAYLSHNGAAEDRLRAIAAYRQTYGV